MQKIKLNNKTFKVFTGWDEITLEQWMLIKGLSKEEKPYYLTTIKPKYAYLVNDKVADDIDKLTAHFFTHEKLQSMPVMFTNRKKYKSYYLPELVTINGNDVFLFNELAYTFCQAHDALVATFSNDVRFMYQFVAYYLRKKGEGVSETEILRRSASMGKIPMSIVLEVLYHHVQYLTLLMDKKHHPNLFGKQTDINGTKIEGLGFTSFLHEWANEKHTSINEIKEKVSDFFFHLTYLRTVRQLK
jgi:hypothetical protein